VASSRAFLTALRSPLSAPYLQVYTRVGRALLQEDRTVFALLVCQIAMRQRAQSAALSATAAASTYAGLYSNGGGADAGGAASIKATVAAASLAAEWEALLREPTLPAATAAVGDGGGAATAVQATRVEALVKRVYGNANPGLDRQRRYMGDSCSGHLMSDF